MVEIVWTKSALGGLDDVAEFIAIDNLAAAKRVVEEITNSVDRLQNFPESDRRIPEILDLPFREIITNLCRVIYKYDKASQCVYVLGVIRQEMDLLRYLQNTNLPS